MISKNELILSWKLVDYIPPGTEFTAQQRKGFVNSRRAKLTNVQMRNLRSTFIPLKDKYHFELQKAFFPETVATGYFRFAGGNYSFSFVLPYVLKDVAQANRTMPIHLKLYELRDDEDLLNEFDFVLSSKYKDNKGHDKQITKFHNLRKLGFNYSKQFYMDEVRFAASKEVIRAMGSKEKVLKQHALIGLKVYRSEGSNRKQITTSFPIKPEGRTDIPRVTSDSALFNYELMKSSFGLWVMFKSQIKSKEIETIGEPTVFIERHCLYRAIVPNKMMIAAKKASFKYFKWVDKENEQNKFC